MKRIFLSAFVAFSLLMTSCKGDDPKVDDNNEKEEQEIAERNKFLSGQDGSVAALYYGDGKFEVEDIETDQVVYSEDRTVYMVSDMEYTNSYTLKIDGKLEKDAVVEVDYTVVGINVGDVDESGSVSMKVVKVDSSNESVWLWDSESFMGFVLHFEPIEE